MSYFVAGLGAGEDMRGRFEALVVDIAPSGHLAAPVILQSAASQFASYDRKKVIEDRLLKDAETGSWLALIGTPILRFKFNMESLAAFFAAPADWLKNHVDGNFAVIAFDAAGKRLIVATDFNSTIPIFYSAARDRVLITSHELVLAKLVKAPIDAFGFAQTIQIGATWGARTRFENISKVQPCEICYINLNGNVRRECYWKPSEEMVESGGLDAHIERWSPLLREAVANYYEAAGRRPVIADFTAGEDGRLLLAQCESLGLPYKAHVTGVETDTDVIIARRAAAAAGFDLLVRQKRQVTEEQLLSRTFQISLQSEAYQDFFKSCTEFATDAASPLDDYGTVKYCGLPGGEAFRGSYYLRGKAFFPGSLKQLDCAFFTKLKYLLDFQPGLMKFSPDEFLNQVHGIARENLAEVSDFPIGTQIDHMLRMFQTALLGLKYKNPVYLPLATGPLTKSIYWLSPRYKQGGRLTKACTERLFPKLAFVKTQNGVPTVRKTFGRLPLFMPEHFAMAKKITSGTFSRLLKWTKPNKWYSSDEWTGKVTRTLIGARPYSDWFSSPDKMVTGTLYNSDALNFILKQAQGGSAVNAPILGRIINNELACRWAAAAK